MLSSQIYVYINIHMYVCMCVCVCVSARAHASVRVRKIYPALSRFEPLVLGFRGKNFTIVPPSGEITRYLLADRNVIY